MSKPVFLDWASTSPIVKYPCSNYGPFMNVNANYAYKEKKLLKECEDRVKNAIGVKDGKVVFGGTSSQLIENLMTAVNDANDIFHWEYNQYMTLGSYVEHDSFNRYIGHRCADLKNLDEWLSYYSDIQTFVVWQGVNNLTGEIFPVADIGKACHEYNALYICDMTAMIGKTPIPANIDQWCDCAVWSGHKLGTELGIGCVWISDELDKWLNGFKLHGTPNLAGALALTQAAEDACDKDVIAKRNEHWLYLFKGLGLSLLDNGIRWIGVDRKEWETGTWAINAIRLPGFNARALQSYLASKEIYIGLGQASCAEEADRRILCQGYGLSEQEADEVVRISFSVDSSVEDVEALIEGIKEFQNTYVK